MEKSGFFDPKREHRADMRRALRRFKALYADKPIADSVLLHVRYDVLRETEPNIKNRHRQHRGYAYQHDCPF
jgi:hypothetical protein